MHIQGLGSINQAASKPAAPPRDRTAKTGVSAFQDLLRAADSYEPSQDSAGRKDLIQQVKKKIRNGFYNTEPVIEDLSHGFAKMMHQLP